MRRFMGITQRDDEDIHEFTLRFKQYRDIAEQHVGRTMFKHAAQHAEDFVTLPEATKNNRIKAEYTEWLPLHYLVSLDQQRYGSILEERRKNFTTITRKGDNHDMFPRT